MGTFEVYQFKAGNGKLVQSAMHCLQRMSRCVCAEMERSPQ